VLTLERQSKILSLGRSYRDGDLDESARNSRHRGLKVSRLSR
jgi:hypothetical protein